MAELVVRLDRLFFLLLLLLLVPKGPGGARTITETGIPVNCLVPIFWLWSALTVAVEGILEGLS